MQKTKNLAVVDNWILQLACELLEFGLEEDQPPRIWRATGYEGIVCEEVVDLEGKSATWAWFTPAHITALLHVIDLLIIYDSVIHDSCRSFVWSHSAALDPVRQILTPTQIGPRLIQAFDDYAQQHRELDRPAEGDDSFRFTTIIDTIGGERNAALDDPFFESPDNDTVESRALFYLALAEIEGATYWPSPERGTFLSIHLPSRLDLPRRLQSSLTKRFEKSGLEVLDYAISFPGFGSALLANCSSAGEILPVIREARESYAAVSFRKWILAVESAMRQGDAQLVAREIASVDDIAAEFTQLLGSKSVQRESVRLQVGLSPSISIGVGAIAQFLKLFLPERGHITFVRTYLERALAAADLQIQIERLFPGLPLLSGRR